MKVKEIMSSPAVTANENDSLEQCARKMLELRIDQLPVVNNDGALTGFISASDFVAKKNHRLLLENRNPRTLRTVV